MNTKNKFLTFFKGVKSVYKDGNVDELNKGYLLGALFLALDLELITAKEAKELTSDIPDIDIDQILADFEKLVEE